MSTIPADKILWIDCEMTGLDIESDELVEIAAIMTDFNLNKLDEGISYVIKPSKKAEESMNSYVRSMHNNSGLLKEIDNGDRIEEVEEKVVQYLKKHIDTKKQKPLLAGNTIGTDRNFIEKQMPNLAKLIHYRNIDVSSIKELARKWCPDLIENAPEKKANHRALDDIKESIQELEHYKKEIFKV